MILRESVDASIDAFAAVHELDCKAQKIER